MTRTFGRSILIKKRTITIFPLRSDLTKLQSVSKRARGSDAIGIVGVMLLSVEDIDNETHLNYYENRNTKLAYNRLA